MLKSLFHPPAHITRARYLFLSVVKVTLLSVSASMAVTAVVELVVARPNWLQAMLISGGVPLLVVPLFSYWFARVLFELRLSKQKIEELSRTDSLTGLNNRRYFFEQAPEALALAQRHGYAVALAVMDLDHFKAINDRYGHLKGDEVLARTGTALAGCIRRTDLLARYGGEEFVLLMPHTRSEEALNLCQRLRQALAQDPLGVGEALPSVTMSVGLACSEAGGYDLEQLLNAADQALYAAKDQGRDRCHLAP